MATTVWNQLHSVVPDGGVVISVLLCSHYIKHKSPTAIQTCVATATPYKPPNAQHGARLTKMKLNRDPSQPVDISHALRVFRY